MDFQAPHGIEQYDLVVRPYRTSDAMQLMRATNDSFEHLNRFMPWATTSQSLLETEALIEEFTRNYADGSDFVFGLFDGSTGTLIGGSGFHLREGPIETQSAEIGMWVTSGRAGQGVGRTALAVLIDWGFTAWPWLRLAWRCNEENIASIRCAEANGLVHEGTLRGQYNPVDGSRRNTVCFSILKSDWAARRRVQIGRIDHR